ncbi:MAG: hypothetical protein AAGB51_09410 [Planctomycetota bacterium]
MSRTRYHNQARRSAPIAALIAAMAGCAAAPPITENASAGSSNGATRSISVEGTDGLPNTQAIAKLRVDAQRSSRPRFDSTASPLPPGIAGADLGPEEMTEAELAVAKSPVADALDAIAQALPSSLPPREPAEDERIEALRLYAAGRASATAGDPEAAVRSLQAAARLDPGAIEIWLALGDAHTDRGGRAASASAYRRAVELGARDARALLVLGADAARSRRHRDAAALYNAVLESDPGRDPVVGLAAKAGLGESLIELGYLAAGNEMLAGALSALDPDTVRRASRATAFRGLLTSLVRRASSQWREIGDRAMRLDNPTRAVDAYERALTAGSNDEFELVLRKVAAEVRSGTPERAALTLLARIWRAGGLVDQRSGQLIAYLAGGDRPLVPELGNALIEMEAALTEEPGPTVRDALVRAAAAAMDDRRAITALRERAEISAGSSELVADLLERASDTQKGWASEAARLAESRPDQARAIATALRLRPTEFASLIKQLDALGEPGASLIAAALYEDFQLLEPALERARAAIDDAKPSSGTLWAATSLAGQFEAELGLEAAARNRLASLRQSAPTNGSSARYSEAVSALLSALNDYSGAAEALVSAPEPAGAFDERDRLFALATLRRATGDADGSAQLVEQALDLDPRSEKLHRLLIELYGPNGPLADEEALARAVQRLRESVPSSRTLRSLAATELFQRGLLDAAEPELRSVADQSPLTVEPLQMLVSLWSRTGRLAQGEAWLRERLARRPASPELSLALGQLMASDGRPDEAEVFMAEQADRAPDVELRRAREQIIREGLEDPTWAYQLALDRFREQGTSLDAVFEHAIRACNLGRLDDAATALRARPLNQTDPVSQQRSIVLSETARNVVVRAAQRRGEAIDELLAPFAEICQLLEPIGAAWPLETHRIRLGAMLRLPDIDSESLGRAIELASQADASIRDEFYSSAAGTLLGSNRGDVAIELTRSGLEQEPTGVLGGWLMRSVGITGDREEVRATARQIADSPAFTESVRDVNDLPPAPRLGENERAAEVAYLIGNIAASAARQAESEEFYRVALSFDPNHIWANNNLGYMLADRGEDIDEAERMIQIAFDRLPGNHNITDSLGWVRYKLGVILDEFDEEGNLVRRGAVSLLSEAIRLMETRVVDGTVRDQAGDAFWAAGMKDQAIRAWNVAMQNATEARDNLSQNASQLPDSPYQRVVTRLNRIRAKLSAVRLGNEPEIAPMLREANTGDRAP